MVEKTTKGKASTRVCLVAPLPPPYGGISHWTKLISDYAKKRADVDLKIINTAPRGRAVYNVSIPLRLVAGGVHLVGELFQLVNLLIKNWADVVHLTSSGRLSVVRDFVILNIVRLFGVKFVYHIRFGRIPAMALANTLEWKVIANVMRHASQVIVIDSETFSAVKCHVPTAKILKIPNCVNMTDQFDTRELAKKENVVLFVGWVVPSKGISELVEAWGTVSNSGWVLKIIGPVSDKYRDELLNEFKPKNLEFLGELEHNEVMRHMASCDLFVLPSYTEGFPNVIAEAMALGRPIVGTRVGAIPEMLDGEAGELIDAKNVKELSKSLELLMGSDNKRERLGNNAYEKAKQLYDINSVFKSYVDVWS